MLEITNAAQQEIAAFFKNNKMEAKPVRLFLNQSGWGGPSLALALDEPNPSDEVFDADGFQVIADKDLLSQAQPVVIDHQGMGFQITSNLSLGGGGCSGCGTSEGGSCSV